jgi:SP family general alpha glucoside:H+ symporter-like MFS transporter
MLALIIHTDNQEKELLLTKTSYWQCFRGVELRRTEVACMTFAGQIFTGLIFGSNSTFFFQQVGLNTDQTYKLNVGSNALALLSTLVSWFLVMPNVGRRKMYIWGCVAMAIFLYLIGILQGVSHKNPHAIGMTQAVLTLLWVVAFQLTVGQLGWSTPAEVGSTRLRQKTVVLARNSYYITSVIASVLEPYFVSPTAWNLRGYTAFVWAGTCTLTGIWAVFRMPETNGRSYEELNVMFANRVPARHFKDYEVDLFGDTETKASVQHVEDMTESKERGNVA